MEDIAELIKEVRKGNRIIEHKEEELERLEARCHVTGISLEEKVSGSRNNSREETARLKLIMYKDELVEYIAGTLDNRKKLMGYIDDLENQQEIDVMYKYCLFNMTMLQIADIMNYSKSNIHKIYTKAIKTIQKKSERK